MAFYSCGRLSAKPVLNSLRRLPLALNTAHYAQAAAVPKVTFKKYEPPKPELYDDKNARLKRPMSPFVIYSPQLTSVLSISHRIAGITLTSYAMALGIGALVLPHDVSQYIMMIEGLNLSAATIFLAKAMIAAPFAYHSANGIRHLYWDTAKGLSIKEVYSTGYAVLATTVALTLFLAAL